MVASAPRDNRDEWLSALEQCLQNLPDSEHRFPLFKRMIKPGVDHLYFLGLAQSSPTIVNLAEQQSKLLARLLTGRYALPPVEEQVRIMEQDEAEHLAQYYAAPRHTIQIDFGRYVVDLLAEIEAGEARAAASSDRAATAAQTA